MKKMSIGLLAVVVLIVVAFILQLNTREDGFSVHDLNWDDIEGMNERIFEAFYTDSPHVYDAQIPSIGYLGLVLNFFRDNLDLIDDTPSGQYLGFKIHFRGITGEEEFLGDVPSSIWQDNNGEFELIFYFDRSLELEFIDVLNEAGWEWAVSQNPEAHDVDITLSEVDWQMFAGNYEAYIAGIILTRRTIDRDELTQEYGIEVADFESNEELSIIVDFLRENQEDFSNIGNAEYIYRGSVHFIKFDEGEPWIIARFFMNESINRRLMDVIGEDVWEQARR